MRSWQQAMIVIWTASALLVTGCINLDQMDPEKYCPKNAVGSDCPTESAEDDASPDVRPGDTTHDGPPSLDVSMDVLVDVEDPDIGPLDIPSFPDDLTVGPAVQEWAAFGEGDGQDLLLEVGFTATVAGEACRQLSGNTPVPIGLPDLSANHFRVRVRMARVGKNSDGTFRPVWTTEASPQKQSGVEIVQAQDSQVAKAYQAGDESVLLEKQGEWPDNAFNEYVWEIERTVGASGNAQFWFNPPDEANWPPPDASGVFGAGVLSGGSVELRGANSCWRDLYVEYPVDLEKTCGNGHPDPGENCDTCPKDMSAGFCDEPPIDEECIDLVGADDDQCWQVSGDAVFDSTKAQALDDAWFTAEPGDETFTVIGEAESPGACIDLVDDSVGMFWKNPSAYQPHYRGQAIFKIDDEIKQTIFELRVDPGLMWEGGKDGKMGPDGGQEIRVEKDVSKLVLHYGLGEKKELNITPAEFNDSWVRLDWEIDRSGDIPEYNVWLYVLDDGPDKPDVSPETLAKGGTKVGEIIGGEVADQGQAPWVFLSGDICLNSYRLFKRKSLCGNGVVDDGEACDDGNVWSGDGCASDCSVKQSVAANCSGSDEGMLWVDPDGDEGITPFQVKCQSDNWVEIASNNGTQKYVAEHYQHGTGTATDMNYVLPCATVEQLLGVDSQNTKKDFVVRVAIKDEAQDGAQWYRVDYFRGAETKSLCDMLTSSNSVAHEWYGKPMADLEAAWRILPSDPVDGAAINFSIDGMVTVSTRALGGSKNLTAICLDEPQDLWCAYAWDQSDDPQRAHLNFWGNELYPGGLSAGGCYSLSDTVQPEQLNVEQAFRVSAKMLKHGSIPTEVSGCTTSKDP